MKPPEPPPWKNTVEPLPGQYAWVADENVKPVGAVGGVVSICSVVVCTEEALPTLSVLNHLIVVRDETWKDAVAAFTVVAVPLVVGSVPSVVYVIARDAGAAVGGVDVDVHRRRIRPAAGAREAVAGQRARRRGRVGLGSEARAALESPALFCAVTDPVCVAAELLKV